MSEVSSNKGNNEEAEKKEINNEKIIEIIANGIDQKPIVDTSITKEKQSKQKNPRIYMGYLIGYMITLLIGAFNYGKEFRNHSRLRSIYLRVLFGPIY